MKRNILFMLMLVFFTIIVRGQNTMEKPLDLGYKSTSFEHTSTFNTSYYYTNNFGRSTNDVFYKFTITVPMDITISHCGSVVTDTYLYFLDANGYQLYYNDNYSGAEQCSNTKHSYLKIFTLTPGSYYVVSEGYSSNGYITTTIKGTAGLVDFTNNQNYIKTTIPTVACNSVSDITIENSMTNYQYFDYLGRHTQTVLQAHNPNKLDFIVNKEYDGFGRESNIWLPVVAHANNNGKLVAASTVKSLSSSLYGDAKAYSYPVYEASPLNRVVEQYGPGQSWHNGGKSVKTQYLTNSATYPCKHYTSTDTRDGVEIKCAGNYANGQLFVTKITDEDGQGITYEFKDKLGNVVLTRQMNGTDSNDTYYVYDSYGNLRAVLPPLAVISLNTGTWTQGTEAVANYAYLYKYDARNRMIGKKLPGAEWITYRYDKADRMIFSQDGEQAAKATKEWTFYLYDAFGREVMRGVCSNTNTANVANSLVTTSFAASNTGIGGSGYSSSFTITSPVVHQVNYYDNYSFRSLTGFNNANFPVETASAKGMLTASVTTVLDTSTKLYSANYYDARGRLANSVSSNHVGGYDKTTTTYTFTGKPKTVTMVHTGKTTQTQVYTYNYDHAERLTTVTHKLNTGGVVTLVSNTYDNLGRLQKKGMHSTSANNSQNYAYNVRSWLTGISGGRFNQNLYYNTGNGSARWNGNISSMTWTAGTETTVRGYKFTYDPLSRISDAIYGESASINGTNKFGEKPVYDKHGNIKSFTRYNNGTAATLNFTHKGNQLATRNGSSYVNDKNGNMTADNSKSISKIEYNSLHLPKQVTWTNGNSTKYLYDATGRKLQTVHKTGSVTKTTDYCGSVIYENNALKRILTDEGYLTLSGATPTYYYYLKDHLGNNRVVIDQAGNVQQASHYYPFGGVFASTGAAVQPYKYNGKELDTTNGLDLYDYEARHMEPNLGRFTTMDPLAEKYYGISPYAYCANNPMRFVDPDGRSYGGPGGPISLTRYLGLTPQQAQDAGNAALKMTPLDDVVVLGSALMGPFTGSGPIHIDGSPASGDEVSYAKSSILLPVSGKAVKEAGNIIDAAIDGIKTTKSVKRVDATIKALRPEGKYSGSGKHGIKWKEGAAEAKKNNKPQGQWGSSDDLDFAGQQAATLEPKQYGYFDLPEGTKSIVYRPDGTVVPATRIWVRNNGTGTFHGYPVE